MRRLMIVLAMVLATLASAHAAGRADDDPDFERELDWVNHIYRTADELANTGRAEAAANLLRPALTRALALRERKPDHLRAKLAVIGVYDKLGFAVYAIDPIRNLDEAIAHALSAVALMNTLPEDTENKYALMRLGTYYLDKAMLLRQAMPAADAATRRRLESESIPLLQSAASALERAAQLDAAGLPSNHQARFGLPDDRPAQQRLPIIYGQLAKTYSELSMWPEAAATFAHLQVLTPDEPIIYRLIAEMHLKREQYEEAAECIVQTLVLGHTELLASLEEIHAHVTGKTGSALTTGPGGQRTLNRSDPWVQQRLAMGYRSRIRALLAGKRVGEARALCDHAVQTERLPAFYFEPLFDQAHEVPPLPEPVFHERPAEAAAVPPGSR